MANTCGNCRFRGELLESFNEFEEVEVFTCVRIRYGFNAAKQGAYLLPNGGDWDSELLVESDFACNKWECIV